MAFSEKISVIIDVVSDNAKAGLQKFRSDIAETEGLTNKFKVGASDAMGMVKGAAGGLALAGGAALVAFGTKAVTAFKDTALQADKFANSSGMAVEDASRWLAVMGKWGVELGDLQDVFNNVASLIDSKDKVFDELGIKIQKNADGTTNMDGTMKELVKTLAKIEDPAKRAAMASKFFGEEGSRQFSELIASGRDVEEIFGKISDQQVIDPEEVEKAKRMQESLRELELAMQDIMMVVGELLVPALTEMGENAKKAFDLMDKMKLLDLLEVLMKIPTPLETVSKGLDEVGDAAKKVGGWLGFGSDKADESTESHKLLDLALEQLTERILGTNEATEEESAAMEAARIQADNYVDGLINAHNAQEEATESAQEQAEQLAETRNQMRRLADTTYDLYDAEADLADSITKATETLADSEAGLYEVRGAIVEVVRNADAMAIKQVELQGKSMDTTAGMDAWTKSMLATANTLSGPMKAEVMAHISRVTGIPKNVLTSIGVNVDSARLRQIEADLNWTARQRFVQFSMNSGTTNRFASGTQSAPPGLALVGEEGPELIQMQGGEKVFTASQTKGMVGGVGATYNIYQNFPSGTRPSDVIKAQRAYERRNGPQ